MNIVATALVIYLTVIGHPTMTKKEMVVINNLCKSQGLSIRVFRNPERQPVKVECYQ